MSDDAVRTAVFRDAVRNSFAFLKETHRLDDLLAKSIALDDDAGYLVPICQLHSGDGVLIERLAAWRDASSFAFPTQFPVTIDGTRSWLRDRLLNVGSANQRLIANSVNLDIVPGEGVDVVADAHCMPFESESFDVCILSAVLQCVRNPFVVAAEVNRVLKPGGVVLVDAPFVQPYCPPVDLYRYSQDGLKALFAEHFDILECDVSIAAGSALAFLYRRIAERWSGNRYAAFALRGIVSLCVLPLSRFRFGKRPEVAGAFFLVGKKR